MLKSPKAQTALVLAVGLLAGYAAASGKLNPFQKVEARAPAQSSAPSPLPLSPTVGERGRGTAAAPHPAVEGADRPLPPCCCGEVSKAGLLLAAHNRAVKEGAAESGKKPNILVLWGDDIGYWNVSAYNRGQMGYRTPNIDRIAREGAILTDCYAQQSCTAGRAAFITGQSPFRTGLLKVGLPGAREGLSDKDPTLADLLRPLGYACGQFGKNHLGDRNEMLPTVHGFHDFFGNLYHLNAEEEPESPDYPKNPEFKKRFGPRGVLRCRATDRDDPTVDPRFGKVGKQTIEDTGPLTRKRMETIDDEITAGALDFIDRAHKEGKPFFVWWNSTRMHIWTRLKKESEGKTGLGIYPDGMVEHDEHVGQLLRKLDELGIAEDTIVLYSTDNGAETFTWPDGGTTPFRSEKNTNWEGGYRVPCLLRWPGVVKPGSEINDIVSHEDWLPTFMAAAGEPDIRAKLQKGYQAGDRTFKVHLDGYDQRDLLFGKGPGKRKEFFYWTDDGQLCALRYGQWKLVFMEQKAHGLGVWQQPLTPLRVPLLFSVRSDPFERADHESGGYDRWFIDHAFVMVPAQAFVAQHLATYKEFPPRQKPGSFNLDRVLEKLQEAGSENR